MRLWQTLLQPGEWLLLGHHRDDQAETVLLKLLRGAGPEGLGGMRALRPLGRGQLWRPLLGLPRAELRDYVEHASTGLHRRPLQRRHPAGAQPAAPRDPAAAAATLAAGGGFHRAQRRAEPGRGRRAATQWLAALDTLHDPTSRQPGRRTAGSRSLRRCASRCSITGCMPAACPLRPPRSGGRSNANVPRAPGQLPCIRWPGAELHIWKRRLWALPPARAIAAGLAGDLARRAARPARRRHAVAGTDRAAASTAPLQVRLRRGGERIKPAGDAHTRELRDLFQQARMPPWRRGGCPLLYADDELVAVADRWMSARAALAIFGHAGATPALATGTLKPRMASRGFRPVAIDSGPPLR